jgi:hypothetical protein
MPAPAMNPASRAEPTSADSDDRLGRKDFPRELSTLLIVAGIGGILLPGPVGAPFLIIGAMGLWPRTFRPIDRFLRDRFPGLHNEGMHQFARFLRDLEHRYPADGGHPSHGRSPGF